MIQRRLLSFTFLLVLLFMIQFVSSISLWALPYGAGSYGTCQYNTCSIEVTTNGTVNFTMTPTVAGVYSTKSDDVTVSTNSSTGYTLSLGDSDTTTSLTSGANNITASSGSQASPATLATNTWGYRVDGLSGFGAGPTSAQDNVSSSSYTFAGVPASDQTTHTIKTTSSAANPPDTTTVWYGVHVDTTKPGGTYIDQVTLTAVTNN